MLRVFGVPNRHERRQMGENDFMTKKKIGDRTRTGHCGAGDRPNAQQSALPNVGFTCPHCRRRLYLLIYLFVYFLCDSSSFLSLLEVAK
jgi:hypothetical protein